MTENTQTPGAVPAQATEVRLTDETIAYIEKRVSAAVADGIKEALTQETAQLFWLAGLKALQDQATDSAGRFVVGGLLGLLRRGALFVVLGSVIYALGGWSAIAAFIKATFVKGG